MWHVHYDKLRRTRNLGFEEAWNLWKLYGGTLYYNGLKASSMRIWWNALTLRK